MRVAVEGLYCKRPIQCLASSEILTPPPHPLTARRVYPPAFGAGGGHTRLGERGWGVKSSEDARHCSVLYICKYFVCVTVCGKGGHLEFKKH
jgi:hypothetical protein